MEKKEEGYVLLIVGIVGAIAIFVLLSQFFDGAASVTGAVVIDQWENKLCTEGDNGLSPLKNSYVNVFYGSRAYDQCSEKASSMQATNNGRFLFEKVCDYNEPDKIKEVIVDCGENKCQYGACISKIYSYVRED